MYLEVVPSCGKKFIIALPLSASAISYCIEYDKNNIELSDVATNTPIKNPTTSSGSVGYSYDIAHDYFEQNTDDFPIGSFANFAGSFI